MQVNLRMRLTSFTNHSLFIFNSNSHSSYFIKKVQENGCTIMYSCTMIVHVPIMLFNEGGLHIFPILDIVSKKTKNKKRGGEQNKTYVPLSKTGKFSPKFIDNKKACGFERLGPYEPESGKLANINQLTDFFCL